MVCARVLSAPLLALAALVLSPAAGAETPAELLAAYVKQAGVPASPERGQKFFNTDFGRDFKGCAECHGTVPTRPGKDAVSEKVIAPMAPAANSRRFTDTSKVEQAFRTNCKDVVGRECTAAEKADLLSWLLTLKP
jgi:Domain of unknown function (DUF1924)